MRGRSVSRTSRATRNPQTGKPRESGDRETITLLGEAHACTRTGLPEATRHWLVKPGMLIAEEPRTALLGRSRRRRRAHVGTRPRAFMTKPLQHHAGRVRTGQHLQRFEAASHVCGAEEDPGHLQSERTSVHTRIPWGLETSTKTQNNTDKDTKASRRGAHGNLHPWDVGLVGESGVRNETGRSLCTIARGRRCHTR